MKLTRNQKDAMDCATRTIVNIVTVSDVGAAIQIDELVLSEDAQRQVSVGKARIPGPAKETVEREESKIVGQ